MLDDGTGLQKGLSVHAGSECNVRVRLTPWDLFKSHSIRI
jgi:hypothetical protein